MLISYALALLLTGPEALAAVASAAPAPTASPAAAEPAPRSLAAPLYGAPEDEEPDEDWHGSVNLGATIASGNSDIITASASADGKKEWEENRVTLKASWSFAEQENDTTGMTEVTQRRWTGSAKYDRFFTEKSYYFAALTLENDDIADLHLRQLYSAGVGHKFKDEEDFKLDGELGLAWVNENYVGRAADDDYLALRGAYALEYVISETTTFLQDCEVFPSLDFSEFNGTLDSRLKIAMTDAMHAMIQWVAKYNNNAPPGTGSTDNLWIFSLGWTY